MTDVVEISSGIEVVETIEGAIEVIEVSGGVTDHGALTGLLDDDHAQYHNDARGDARYALIAQGVTNGDSHDHSGGDGAQISYSGLSGLPTLGSAAATDSTAYATAAQGSTADTALQPGDDAADLGSGAATDGYVLTADGAGGAAWEAAVGGDVATAIHAATQKTTPVDADELPLVDSAASYVLKKLTWANLKATLSSVFAVLAGKSGGQTLIGGTGITDKLILQGTSGNGTLSATALEVRVGNNGGTRALNVLNNGNTRFGVNNWLELFDTSNGNGNFKSPGVIAFDVSSGILIRNNPNTFEWIHAGYGVNGVAFPTGTTLIGKTTSDYYNKLQVEGSAAISQKIGVGTTSMSAAIHAINTAEQLRLGYDATYYSSFTVNSSGALTQAAIGGQTLIGGTGVDSKIVLQGTSANGTSTAAALEMKVGNNGSVTAMTMKNDGNIYIPGIIENTTSGEGIILKSPDGTRYKVTVANGGTLSVSAA